MSKLKSLLFLGGILLIVLALIPAHAYQAAGSSAGNTVYLPYVDRSNPPTPTPARPGSSGSTYTFISWADTKTGTAVLAALSDQAKKLNPAFTIYPGDLVNGGFNTSGMNAWKNALNGDTNNGIYDITMPLRGNHDTSNPSGWQAYLDTAGVAARIGATGFSALAKNLTYSYTYGNAVFIGIDVPGDASLITSAEVSYLDGMLSNAESRGLTHAFIFFHGPIYAISAHTSCPTRTCATPSSIASLVNVLNKHPIVSATFHGHEHVMAYVHLDSSRVPEITRPFEEFITGSAGAELYTCDKMFRFDYCGSYAGFDLISVSGKMFTVSIYEKGQAGPVMTYSFAKP